MSVTQLKQEIDQHSVIEMLRKQHTVRLRRIIDKYGQHLEGPFKSVKTNGKQPGTVVSTGLMLRRKEDGMLVTVDSIDSCGVHVDQSDGRQYTIDIKKLDDEYELA